jgi:glutathione S-transferase
MYELYIGNKNYSSWSLRPWVLMQVLGIPFKETLVPFSSTRHAEYQKFSPSGKVPCLVDDGFVVWDSLAIAEYLAERHAGVWPADAMARSWARSAAAEMHSGFATLRNVCGMNCGLRIELVTKSPALLADIVRIDELWTDGLDRFGGPFLAGDQFTAVDAFFAPVAFRAQTYGILNEGKSAEYVARLLNLPAMQSWYRDGIAETFRDEPHEAEARQSGVWVEDLRATAG